MSHINDLIGVVRGLRLILKAGANIQQESAKLKWNNSSIKSLIENCQTNNHTSHKSAPNSNNSVISLEKAYVVAHGIRQYLTMYAPGYAIDIEKKAEMDPHLNDEIEELNREFHKTFEVLAKERKHKQLHLSSHTDQNENTKVSPPPPEPIPVPQPVAEPIENKKIPKVKKFKVTVSKHYY